MERVADLLRRGIAAVRSGRKQEAERLLRQAIASDPDNEWAWFWLSAAVRGIEAQRECLHRVLEINPDNGYARSGLAFLSRIRPGQEWQAEDAPWTEGIDERVMRGSEPPRRCPRCGTINPGWAYRCSRCGAVLQTIDLVKVVQQEERIYSRSSAGLSVMEAWAGAIALKGEAAFGPEVELASWRRSLSALAVGALFFVLLRQVIPGLIWLLGVERIGPFCVAVTLFSLLKGDVLAVVGIGGGMVALALISFLPARLLGGKGSLGVHFHLLSVAVSAWMFVTSVLVLIAWLLPLASPDWEIALAGLLLVAFLSSSYLLVLLTQALRVAHRIAGILALVLATASMGAIVVGLFFLQVPLEGATCAVLRAILGNALPWAVMMGQSGWGAQAGGSLFLAGG